MSRPLLSTLRRATNQLARSAFSRLPRPTRFALYRRLVRCEPQPDARLSLKIADTQDELEACFRILHDAYVASGFMAPHPSGLRVTVYHALPTTTTLCAKWDGHVVGTISIIREGVFGFPLQSVFDLHSVRARHGNIAEISALAIDPAFRKTGGKVLFPLMKFMYEYCREYFDTRHILIAVNPNRIEMYESLLFFERLQAQVVDNYDFANGAPAVGATLDLQHAPELFRAAYDGRPPGRDLHHYFTRNRMSNIQWPQRRFFTTNDPVLTPAMMDHFFNRRTQAFASLDDRRRLLLRSIYDDPAYADVLPRSPMPTPDVIALRRHRRFSIRCPARFVVEGDGAMPVRMTVIEVSLSGLQVECTAELADGAAGAAEIDFGEHDRAAVQATVVRRHEGASLRYYGLRVEACDDTWRQCVHALQTGRTHADLAPQVRQSLPQIA